MAGINAEQLRTFAQSIPGLLSTHKIRKTEAATALHYSRQAFYKKVNNPSSWKVGELIILSELISSKK